MILKQIDAYKRNAEVQKVLVVSSVFNNNAPFHWLFKHDLLFYLFFDYCRAIDKHLFFNDSFAFDDLRFLNYDLIFDYTRCRACVMPSAVMAAFVYLALKRCNFCFIGSSAL